MAYAEFPSDPRVRREVQVLAENGYSVTLIALQSSGDLSPRKLSGLRLCELPLRVRRGNRALYLYQYTMFFLLSAALLLSLHVRRRFSVVHVHSLPDFLVFCALPERILGARVVLDLHESMPEILAARFNLRLRAPLVRIARIAERASCAVADHVVVPARFRRDLIVERGVAPHKVVVVPNAPDEDFLRGTSDTNQSEEADLEGRWLVVHAGGINKERDLETLIDAGKILSMANPTTILLFGRGDEGYKGLLVRRSSGSGGNLEVRLGDWIPPQTIRRYVELCRVGVVTYERNPITDLAAPNRVLEFAAARKPLVLADVRALRTDWGEAALFYEPGDPEDLASKIRRVLDDGELASRLVANADLVYEGCNWEHSKAALLSLYRDIQRDQQ